MGIPTLQLPEVADRLLTSCVFKLPLGMNKTKRLLGSYVIQCAPAFFVLSRVSCR